MNKIQMWWGQTQPRERRFVLVGGGLAAFIFFYVLVWSPLTSAVVNVKQDYAYKQKLYSWMQTHVDDLLRLKKVKPSSDDAGTTALIIIERELNNSLLSGFDPQIKKGQKEAVSLTFQAVPFDELIQWLGQLYQRNGIGIAEANISQTDKPGMVRATLNLTK